MDIQDADETGGDFGVVKSGAAVLMLDSGADVSVVPEEFAKYGGPGSQGLVGQDRVPGKLCCWNHESSPHVFWKVGEARLRHHQGRLRTFHQSSNWGTSTIKYPFKLEKKKVDLHICSIAVEKPEELEQHEMHEDEIRVTALQGFVCRELAQLSLTPGWHVLVLLPTVIQWLFTSWIHVAISMLNSQLV